MFNRKTSVNGTKGIKRTGKAVAFIALLIMLTLVFTMYQTSVNEVGSTVLDALNITSDNIIPVTNEQVAEAATTTYSTTIDGWSKSESQGMWGTGSESTTQDLTKTITAPSYLKKAIASDTITCTVSTAVTTTRSKDDNDYCKTTVRIKISTTTSTKADMTQYGYGENSNGTVSGSYKIPTNATVIYICVEAWVMADGKNFNDASTTLNVGTINVVFTSSDTTAPTLSTDEGINWTSKDHFNIADSSTGVREWSYNYTSPSGTSASKSGSYDEESSKSTSKSVQFQNDFGKYVITAKDNAGNSRSYTIYYYNPTLSVVPSVTAGGSATIGKGTSTGSATSINGLSPSDNYTHTLSATTKSGYFFTGWKGSGIISDQGVGDYVSSSGDTHTWKFSTTLNAGSGKTSVPSSSSAKYTAQFKAISDYFPSGYTLTYTFDNNSHGIAESTIQTNIVNAFGSQYTVSVNYTSSDCVYDGGTYNSKTQPTFAGTYTMAVTVYYGQQTIGYGTYTLKITPMTLKMVPTFTYRTKVYDGTTSTDDLEFAGWEYEDGFEYSTICKDKLSLVFTNSANLSLVYNSANAGSHTIVYSTAANEKEVTITSNATNGDKIAKSCIFSLSTTQTVSAEITKRPLSLSASASDYDGTVTGYVKNSAYEVTGVPGKVYDGSNYAKINAISVGNAVDGETITVKAGYTATFNKPDASTDEKDARVTVSGITLVATNGNLTNYAVNENIATGTFSITVKGLTIVRKPVSVSASLIYTDASPRKYDGTKYAEIASISIEGLCSRDGSGVTLEDDYYALFGDKNCGTQKDVTIYGLKLTNTGGSYADRELNYYLASDTLPLKANIVQKSVTVSITSSGKTYDGNTSATVAYVIEGAIDGDDVNATGTAVYDSKDVGLRTITASNITLNGKDSKNYSLDGRNSAQKGSTISKKSLDSSGISIGLIPEYTFDGKDHKPTPDVIDAGLPALTEDDFGYIYDGNLKSAGTKTLKIQATNSGNYSGEISTTYTIKKADCQIVDLKNITVIYGQKIQKSLISATVYNKYVYDLSEDENLVVEGTWEFVDAIPDNGILGVKDSGTKYVRFTLAKTHQNNYNAPEDALLTLTVTKRPITITASAQTSVYGDDIKFNALKYTAESNNDTDNRGLVLTSDYYSFGNLRMTATKQSDVGEYPIQGDTLSSDNYSITYVANYYTITKRPITVRPESQTKTYGDDDPALTYIISGGLGTAPIEGSLQRTAGENQGIYNITQGTITDDNNPNYVIAFVENVNFIINRRTVEITPKDAESYFGETIVIDNTAFTVTNVAKRDTSGVAEEDLQARYTELFPITVVRTEQNSTRETTAIDAREYSLIITSGSTQLNSNYSVKFNTGKYTVQQRPIIITPNENQSKAFGDADPVFSYTVTVPNAYADILTGSPVVQGYPLDGTLTRSVGEDVGDYLISEGTLSASNYLNANYSITFSSTAVFFKINQKVVNVYPVAITVNYGDDNPDDADLTFVTDPVDVGIIGGLRLPNGEKYPGETTPVSVGSYPMLADPTMLNQNPNYNITVYGEGKFTIKRLTALIAPESYIFTFGDKLFDGENNIIINIAFTATDELKGTLIDSTHFNGNLGLDCTVPADGILTAGTYGASLGSLSSPDYVLKLDNADNTVTIEPKLIYIDVVGADKDNSLYYVYGNASTMPDFSVSESTPLVDGYPLSARSTLSRINPGTNTVGTYAVTVGNLPGENKNYTFAFETTYYFVIAPRPIIIVPNEASSVYGSTDSAITYTTVSAVDTSEKGLLNRDTLSGSLSRTPGKDVGEYTVTLGSLNNSGDRNHNPNYSVTLSSTPVSYFVTRKLIQISAKAVSQVFGEKEQALTINYKYLNQLVGTDILKGTLTREPGETVGSYKINQGTVDNDNNPNYNVVFDSAGSVYTITQRPVTLRANSATKMYGTEDPVFTYTAILGQNTTGTPFAEGYDPSPYISVSRAKGESANAYSFIINVDKNQDVVKNYKFTTDTNSNKFTITKATTAIGFSDGTYLDSDGKYRLDITYDGTLHNVNAIVTAGDASARLDYRINGKIAAGFTNAGEYVVSISVNQTANYNGISLTVYVTVAPYDLGVFDIEANIAQSALSKVYGQSDKRGGFNAVLNGIGSQTVTASLTRAEGENAGSYDFTAITLSDNNYIVTLGENALGAFTILPKEIEVEPLAYSKVYGESDPVLRQSVNGINNETFVAQFTRANGENVGSYNLTAVTSLDTNYAPVFKQGSDTDAFTISKKSATVYVDDICVMFNGSAHSTELTYSTEGFMPYDDPEFTLTVNGFALGEVPVLAGKYDIKASAPAEDIEANYDVTVQAGVYTVEKAPVTVTASAVIIEYGYPVPEFTYAVTVGTVFDSFPLIGSLGTIDSINVGVYDIPQGTLTDENNPNYALTFADGATLTITTRHITVTPAILTEQVYGDPHAEIAFTVTYGELVDGETLAGALESDNYNFGTHSVVIGSLQDMNPNYDITLDAKNAVFSVSKRPVVVKANAVSSAYGDPVEPLTYVVNGVDGAFGLVPGDTLNGELFANIGSNVGTYPVSVGTLSSDNYDITFESAVYSVVKRNVTVTLLNQSSDFGAPIVIDPRAYSVTDGSVIDGDDLGIVLVKELGDAMGDYPISATFDNQNYNVTFVNGVYTVRKYSASISVASDEFTKVFDGNPISIVAEVSGTAKVRFFIDGKEVSNAFVDIGKYYVEITADETDEFYAPESVFVTVIVKRGELITEDSGIDVKVENQDGFDPDVKVDMKKLPQDDSDMNSVLSSNQTIVGAFSIGTIDEENFSALSDTNVLRIKVPSALSDTDTVKVVISDENGSCSLNVFDVEDGYITVSAKNVKAFAFVQETPMNLTFLYYLFAGIALIVIVSVIVFAFHKRA